MKIWLTTDTHFGHAKMLEYENRPRDFEKKIFKPLSQIPREDTLIHLGDVCMGQDASNHGAWIFPLACNKVLVLGNHDKKSHNWYMEHGWNFVCDGLRLKMFGKKILLTHRPQADDGWYDINIHGHFHSNDHRSQEPEIQSIYTEKHKLLALELNNYQPVLLSKFMGL